MRLFTLVALLVYLLFLTLILFAPASHADTDQYEIDFGTADGDSSRSVLVICNADHTRCTKEYYDNAELVRKTYDHDKAIEALDRIDATQDETK